MSDPYLMTLPWERENSDTPRADKIIREYLDKEERYAEDTERDLHAPMQRLERELNALSSENTDIPEGRGSPLAGALESGSPHTAARDVNPEGAASGGVCSIDILYKGNK